MTIKNELGRVFYHVRTLHSCASSSISCAAVSSTSLLAMLMRLLRKSRSSAATTEPLLEFQSSRHWQLTEPHPQGNSSGVKFAGFVKEFVLL